MILFDIFYTYHTNETMKLIDYIDYDPFINEPIGTKWTGTDYKHDFFNGKCNFTVTYLKNEKGIAKFEISNKKRKLSTVWRESCHPYFSDRYNLRRREIPMNTETKNQIFILEYLKILFKKKKIPIDVENIVYLFLGCKMNLLKKMT